MRGEEGGEAEAAVMPPSYQEKAIEKNISSHANRSLWHSSLCAPPDVTLGNSLLLFDGHKVRRRIIAGLLKSLSFVLLWNTIVFACEPLLGVANLQAGARSRSPPLTHGDTFKKLGGSSR